VARSGGLLHGCEQRLAISATESLWCICRPAALSQCEAAARVAARVALGFGEHNNCLGSRQRIMPPALPSDSRS